MSGTHGTSLTALVSISERVRRSAILILATAGILAFVPVTLWDPFAIPKLAVLVACAAVAAAATIFQVACGKPLRALSDMLPAALLLIVPLTVAWTFAPYRSWSLMGEYHRFLGLIPYVLLATVGIIAVDAFRGRSERIASALCLGGGIAGAYSIIQAFQLDPFVWADLDTGRTLGLVHAFSTIGNSNFAGGVLAMILPVAVGLSLATTHRRTLAVTMASLIFMGWVLSFSQGAWMAGIGGLSIVMGQQLRARWTRAVVASGVLNFAVAIALVSPVIFSASGGDDYAPFGITVEHRAWAWESAIDMSKRSPWVGRGPNAFAVEGVRYRPAEEALTAGHVADDPHSVPLSFLTATGVFGMLAWVGLAVWAVRAGVDKTRHLPASPLLAGFFGATVAYFLQALVGIDDLSIRIVFWMALAGLVATQSSGERAWRSKPAIWAPIAGILAVALIVAGVLYSYRLVVADHRIVEGFVHAQDNEAAASSASFQRAIALRDHPQYRLIYGTKIGELGLRRDGEGAAYIDEMRAVFDYLEGFPQLLGYVHRGRILHSWGVKADPAALVESLGDYRTAISIDPHHPLLRVETSDVLLALDRPDDALALLQPFESRDPPFAEYWGALALVYVNLGDETAAKIAADRATKISPTDPRALEALEMLRANGS